MADAATDVSAGIGVRTGLLGKLMPKRWLIP